MEMPTAVGPQRLSVTLVEFWNSFELCLTAVWIVNAGRPMDATAWNTLRFTATSPSRVGSEKFAASQGVGPCSRALYVVNATSPIRYAHEIPYAAVTVVRNAERAGTYQRREGRRGGTPLRYPTLRCQQSLAIFVSHQGRNAL